MSKKEQDIKTKINWDELNDFWFCQYEEDYRQYFNTHNVEESVEKRLLKFLVKDKAGIRKCLLNLFLQTRNYTTCEIYDYLKKQGFEVNYRGVSSMVGQMHTRLGILHIYLQRKHRRYSLKEDHRNIIQMILIASTIFPGKSLHNYQYNY
jgi:Protein of unknown function (DUF2551)